MKALISVYDKTGIADFAKELTRRGIELLSTGGTLKAIEEAGLAVTAVEDVTGSAEMLGGRVKTLHPSIHGALLARRDDPEHMGQIQERGIDPIDLVVCNLYPFEEGLKRDLEEGQMVELIDIGGPSMLRSAAKNFSGVCVLCESGQYEEYLNRFDAGELDLPYRKSLSAAAFAHCSAYDARIASYLNPEPFPMVLNKSYQLAQTLRYGENPHQEAAFYVDPLEGGVLGNFTLLGGKPLSYNNLRDVDAALGLVLSLEEKACVAVKHLTPCGVAVGETPLEAFERAYSCDPVSIFGGIVAFNQEVDGDCAKRLNDVFLEIVAAVSFTEEALDVLRTKKNLRIMQIESPPSGGMQIVSVDGGLLLQSGDNVLYEKLEVVSERAPSEEEMQGLLFAFQVVKFAKSNAIVVSDGKQASGIGAGNVSRIEAAKVALEKGQGGTLLASDAFFPFSDVVEEAAKYGIKAIIQPGGSIHDKESIDVCNKHGIALVFTGMRHFRH